MHDVYHITLDSSKVALHLLNDSPNKVVCILWIRDLLLATHLPVVLTASMLELGSGFLSSAVWLP